MKTVEVNVGMVSNRKISHAAETIKVLGFNAGTEKSKEALKIAYAVMRNYVKYRRDRRDNLGIEP